MCHAQNLFHGLLKPSNLMVSPEGQVRILDLGIGSLLAETEGESLVDTMSSANSMASGLDCASPESIMDPNNLTPIGDQYSLGCVLYFCLTGRYPFPDGTAVDKMMAHQMREPEAVNDLNPEIPSALAEVVDRLMQKTPAARFPSTHEVIEALQPLAGPPPVSARPGPGRKSRSERRLVSPPLGDTPRPERRLPSSGVLNDPSRLSSRGAHSRQQMPGSQPDPERQAPSAPEPSVPQEGATADPFHDKPKRGWEEKLGPVGVALCAIIACAIAWLLTWKLF